MLNLAAFSIKSFISTAHMKVPAALPLFNDITFAYPWMFWLLAIVPIMLVWYWYQGKKKQPAITYSSLTVMNKVPKTWKERYSDIPVIFRAIGVGLLIVALARPQTFNTGENMFAQGIDIAMLLDISGSMLAEDLKPNRVGEAKKVIDNFIEGRTSDRIGLVIFSREAFTQCPLTIDYSVLRNLLSEVKPGMIEDGTAIGNAIANGVNRLKDSDSKSKIIILLTDGMNNAGEIDPISAARIAKVYNIRIYTIGVGSKGEAPYPVQTPFGIRYQMIPAEIDEPMLNQIASITDGKFYRATNNNKLEEIYKEIDRLEKTKIEVTSYRNAKELFLPWLGLGLMLIFLEVALSKTIFKRLP